MREVSDDVTMIVSARIGTGDCGCETAASPDTKRLREPGVLSLIGYKTWASIGVTIDLSAGERIPSDGESTSQPTVRITPNRTRMSQVGIDFQQKASLTRVSFGEARLSSVGGEEGQYARYSLFFLAADTACNTGPSTRPTKAR